MQARAIVRTFHKIIEGPGRERIAPGLSQLLGGEDYVVDVYTVHLDSVVVQLVGEPDARAHRGPLAVAEEPWRSYCRWHSGPLASRDEPWTRIYCTVEAEDYCRYHRRSLRALYDVCLSLRAPQALEACSRVDQEVRGEYSVYLTHTGRGVKVGVTRRFRLVERVSEQPHSLATELASYDSLYQARKAELRISRSGLATESSPRKARRPDPGSAAPALSYVAERAARLLGVEWSGVMFRVRPPPGLPGKVYNLRPGSVFEIKSYWGGLLLADVGGSLVVVKAKDLLHKDSVVIP